MVRGMYNYSAPQREGRPAWPCLLLTIFAIVIGLALGPLHAQVADPSEPPAGVTVTATTDAAETEPDAGPIYPAGLADPRIPLEELELRLLPLNVEQLSALATAWQEIVAHQTLGVVEATLEAERLEDDRRNAALERIVALAEIRDLGFAHFTAVVNELDRKGGDEAVVATLRSYRSSIIVEEKQRADWRTLVSQALNWLASPDGGVELGI